MNLFYVIIYYSWLIKSHKKRTVMKKYCKPALSPVHLNQKLITQSVSGETLGALSCSGAVSECESALGVNCECNNFLDVTFLVPNVDCADIHDGADCSLTPTCSNQDISAQQCGEGCLVHVTCTTQCNGLDFTASCPGFDDCSANAGATGC
jgi:hypothetical protein